MPYFRVETNLKLDQEKKTSLLSQASRELSQELGKPERYVMVQLVSEAMLMFDGTMEPAAYVELKSIGLPETQTQPLAQSICGFLQQELDIPPDRVYIEFIDIPRKLWGWNGSTF